MLKEAFWSSNIILLIGHSNELFPKFLSLYTWTNSPPQQLFFVVDAVNAETHSWLTCRGKETVEQSDKWAICITVLAQRLKDHQRIHGGKTARISGHLQKIPFKMTGQLHTCACSAVTAADLDMLAHAPAPMRL